MVWNIFYLALWPDPLPAGRAALAECRVGLIAQPCSAMSLWGTEGVVKSWVWDPSAEVGATGDLAAEVTCAMDDCTLVTLFPCGSKAKVMGRLCIPSECSFLTIFGAALIEKEPLVFLVDDPSSVLFHRRVHRDDLWNFIELCSGLGIGAMGFHASGMKIVAACDWSEPFTTAFAEVHPFTPVITGDIGDAEVIKKLHQAHSQPAVLMSGFSCQPFSTGGKQLGALDDRSSSLEKSLHAGFMLRSPLIILECVQDASTNAMVRKQLSQFCTQCGYHLTEAILKLEDVWCSRRTRWWAILSAAFLGAVPLPAFEHPLHPAVPSLVLPSPLVLSPSALQQLELSGDELDQFLTYEPNLSRLLLKRDVQAPTALHSWGSQVSACHCLCRSGGFSHETLSSRGLFGLLLPVPGHDPNSDRLRVRHPHPLEVGLLNGVPELVWPDDLRLVLAGLGQMCCPLHTVWVGAHLQHHVDCVFTGSSRLDPSYLLDQLRAQVMNLATLLNFEPIPHVALPEPPIESVDLPLDDPSLAPWSRFCHVGNDDEVTVVLADDPTPFVVRVADPAATVASVVAGWLELNGPSDDPYKVIDCLSGRPVQGTLPAGGRCLWLMCDLAATDAQMPVPLSPASHTVDPPVVDVDTFDHAASPSLPDASVVSSTVSPRLEPLAALDADSLATVPVPSVPDVATVSAMRRQTMSAEVRKQVLANQSTLWSDDELMWHLGQMLAVANKPTWALLDPLLAAEAMKRPSSGLLAAWIRELPVKPTAILGVVMAKGHWTPFIWTWTPHCMIASSWDVPGSPAHEISMLHTSLATAVGSRSHTVHVVHWKFAVDSFCGLCALRFLDHMIRGKMLPTDMDEVKYLHSVGRSLFVNHLDSVVDVPRPWIWGAGLDSKAAERLHSLLLEHGVEASQVKNRSHLLVQAIGLATAQRALTGGQPWRSLKQAANNCRPAFQLVLPAELEQVVKSKAEQGGLRTKRKKPAAAPKPSPKLDGPPALDPAKLSIEEASFVGPGDSALNQLQMTDIGPLAAGVVLSTVEESNAYLKAGQLVSQGPLALLLLNVHDNVLSTALAWSTVRVVLRCHANGEPLLAPGVLVQLGKHLVQQTPGEKVPDVMHTAVACVKFALYRDSVDCDWTQVVNSPVKFVLSLLEPLSVCQGATSSLPCPCPKWHPAVGDHVADPVVDVWRRQWLSLAFRPVAPAQADIFLVNMRFLESLLDRVLSFSGRGGLYIEPRTLDSKDPSLDFQILWLTKTPHEELLRLQQCNSQILGLARLGNRHGVRCRTADAPELAKVLKPSSVFLAAGAKQLYEVGPLPYGLDRFTLSKLLGGWQWQARPLHPARSAEGAQGNIWLIQASAPPPHPVVRYQGNDIVINTVPDKPSPPGSAPSKVVANAATVKLCSKEAGSSGFDPWTLHDPWSPLPAGGAGRVSGASESTLKDFETRLEQSILSKIPPAQMEVDSSGEQEARLIALEQQVNALTAGQRQLDQKIDESSTRQDAQYQSLHSQVHQQMESHGQQMQSLFTAQMQQIEALLSKKLRTE